MGSSLAMNKRQRKKQAKRDFRDFRELVKRENEKIKPSVFFVLCPNCKNVFLAEVRKENIYGVCVNCKTKWDLAFANGHFDLTKQES